MTIPLWIGTVTLTTNITTKVAIFDCVHVCVHGCNAKMSCLSILEHNLNITKTANLYIDYFRIGNKFQFHILSTFGSFSGQMLVNKSNINSFLEAVRLKGLVDYIAIVKSNSGK